MEIEINHYEILGLQTTEEEEDLSKLTLIEISKAYRIKALELHPDKRPNDPNAVVEFQQLKSSYEILKDEKARKLFDDLLRVKFERKQKQSQYDSKRSKMVSDLNERERASSVTPDLKVKREEERIAKLFMEEIERIRAKHGRGSGGIGTPTTTTTPLRSEQGKSEGLDGEKVLKVSWEGSEDDYSSQKLRDLFKEFGDVEDVVIRSTGSKRKRTKSALVVMANKDAAVSAMGTVCGDLSNPLLVLPLNKVAPTVSPSPFPPRYVEPEVPVASNLVGASYQAKEASILDKLRKAAEKQK